MSDYTPGEKFTPNLDEARLMYAEAATLHTMEEPHLSRANASFDRFIAKVKADALRSAAEATRGEAPEEPYAGCTFSAHANWLEDRADRIESGDGQ